MGGEEGGGKHVEFGDVSWCVSKTLLRRREEGQVPRGKSFKTSCLLSFSGYGGNCSFVCPLRTGGIVMRGFGLVSANTRALATLSAYVLNSAPGVIWFRRFSDLRKCVSGCLMRLKWGIGMDMMEGE